MRDPLRVLLGPTNFAGQPIAVTRALREHGVEAEHVTYAWGGRSGFGYARDTVVELNRTNWLSVQLGYLERVLERDFDVYHFWHRSLVHGPGAYGFYSGLDLPYIRGSGASVVYRFTGYDLRVRSIDMNLNPHSPFHNGYDAGYREDVQAAYLAQLRGFVDCFVVQDPEMQAFLPEAQVIPRGIDLEEFAFVGIENKPCPLVVHAPSSPQLKGTAYVLAAVETLRERGLSFEFKLIEDMAHHEALDWYRRADIVIDQLLIGWYGVTALEGMALGKPVIAYVREPLCSSFSPSLPIANATPDTITDVLANLIQDARQRQDLSMRGRAFAEQVHDIKLVAAQYAALYDDVRQEPATLPAPRPVLLNATASEPLDSLSALNTADRLTREADRNQQKIQRLKGEVDTLAGRLATRDAAIQDLRDRWKAERQAAKLHRDAVAAGQGARSYASKAEAGTAHGGGQTEARTTTDIEALKKRLAQRDETIARLREQLTQRTAAVSVLTERVERLGATRRRHPVATAARMTRRWLIRPLFGRPEEGRR